VIALIPREGALFNNSNQDPYAAMRLTPFTALKSLRGLEDCELKPVDKTSNRPRAVSNIVSQSQFADPRNRGGKTHRSRRWGPAAHPYPTAAIACQYTDLHLRTRAEIWAGAIGTIRMRVIASRDHCLVLDCLQPWPTDSCISE